MNQPIPYDFILDGTIEHIFTPQVCENINNLLEMVFIPEFLFIGIFNESDEVHSKSGYGYRVDQCQ